MKSNVISAAANLDRANAAHRRHKDAAFKALHDDCFGEYRMHTALADVVWKSQVLPAVKKFEQAIGRGD